MLLNLSWTFIIYAEIVYIFGLTPRKFYPLFINEVTYTNVELKIKNQKSIYTKFDLFRNVQ